ncbi:hypothetical protein RI367_007438 [Sorochytrium milnesiophthora]
MAETINATLNTITDKFFELYGQMSRREIGHKTVDRKTGKVVRERQPFTKQARELLLFNPAMEVLDQTEAVRHAFGADAVHAGHKMNQPHSAREIEPFVKFHEINMDWFEPEDLSAYKTFNEFFVRKLKPGARPIDSPNDPTVITSAADCRVVVFETVEESKALWIKGKHFTIGNVIEDQEKAKIWANGAIVSFRLAPQDYHHYHSPVDGKVEWFKELDGTYYGVDPIVTNSKLSNLCANARTAVCINSPTFGRVLYVAIGAEGVGTVNLTEAVKNNCELKKGDEVGTFTFGGSNVLVAFEPGRVQWDEDLIRFSREQLEANVKMGEHIGRLATSNGHTNGNGNVSTTH